MKHFNLVIAAAFAVAAGLQAHADGEGPKMVLNASNGTKTEVLVKSISNISFSGSNMRFTTDQGPMQFDVLKLDNITFDLEANAGETINRVFDDGVSITVCGCAIDVTSGNSDSVKVSVYNISGVCVMQGEGVGNVSLDLNSLTQGIYIVRANNKTVKFIR